MTAKESFNKAAITYDTHCQLQLTTGERLLSLIEPADNVIDLGCGTGITSAKLKYKKLYALDIANKLLELAKIRLGNENVIYLETSFDDFSGLELDLAFANMSLQWSNDLQLTLKNIKANLKPGGALAFSIPLAGTFTGLNIPSISFLSYIKVVELLANWQITYADMQKINYPFSSLIEALRSIKSVGAHYCTNKSNKLISRDKSPCLLQYQIGYFMVKK